MIGTNRNDLIGFIVVFLLVVGAICATDLLNRQVQRHTILTMDKVESREGSSDGFSTYVYYIVATDKGAYRVETKGLNAAPQCTGLKQDSTYLLTTRGLSIPLLGIYPNIIDVE